MLRDTRATTRWQGRRALLASALTMAALASRPARAETVKLRIGVPGYEIAGHLTAGISPITWIVQQKLLEKEVAGRGVEVEWIFFKGLGPAVNEAFASGQIDFALVGDLPAIIARSAGLPTRYLIPFRGLRTVLAVLPGAGIKSVADLRGKKIAVTKGTAFQLALDRALSREGLGEKDLEVLNLDYPAILSALAAKRIDGAWIGAQADLLVEKGLVETPVANGLFGRETYIAAHPEETAALVRVLINGLRVWGEPAQLDALVEETAAYSGFPASLGRAEFRRGDIIFKTSPRFDPFIVDATTRSIAAAHQAGLIRRGFDVNAWIDPRFVGQALRDLKLEQRWPLYAASGQAIGQ